MCAVLVDVDLKGGLLQQVDEELSAFSSVVAKNKNFSAFLTNPTIPRAEKTAKIGAFFEEGKVSHITRNLFLTLAANGRIGEFGKVHFHLNLILFVIF